MLISESIDTLIEEITREKQRSMAANAVKQRFSGTVRAPTKYKTTLKRKVEKSVIGRLAKRAAIEASTLKDKVGIYKDKIKADKPEVVDKDETTSDKVGKELLHDAGHVITGAYGDIKNAGKYAYDAAKNSIAAAKNSKSKTVMGKVVDSVKGGAKTETDSDQKITALKLGGTAFITKLFGKTAGTAAYAAANIAQGKYNNLKEKAHMEPNELRDKLNEKLDAARNAKVNMRAVAPTKIQSEQDKQNEEDNLKKYGQRYKRVGYIETEKNRNIRHNDGTQKNPDDETAAELSRAAARQADLDKRSIDQKAKDNAVKAAQDPKSKSTSTSLKLDPVVDKVAAQANSNAINDHKQKLARAKSQSDIKSANSDLANKIDTKNLTSDHKDYLRQTGIMESNYGFNK